MQKVMTIVKDSAAIVSRDQSVDEQIDEAMGLVWLTVYAEDMAMDEEMEAAARLAAMREIASKAERPDTRCMLSTWIMAMDAAAAAGSGPSWRD